MDGQLSFARLDYAGKKKRTKRDVCASHDSGRCRIFQNAGATNLD